MHEVYDHGTWFWDIRSASYQMTKPGLRELNVVPEIMLDIPDEHVRGLIDLMKERGEIPTIDMRTNEDLLKIVNRLLDQTEKAMPKAKVK